MARQKGSPKRKRLSEEQVQEMLRLRRQGQSVKAIAQAIGCHRQTVRIHLKERHGDILAEEARKQVLIEELRGHFEELAKGVPVSLKWRLDASPSGSARYNILRLPGPIALSGRLGLPGRGPAFDTISEWVRMYNPLPNVDHLTQALREHTKDSDLWVYWDSWREEVADYETPSGQLIAWVMDKTELERWRKIDPEYMDKIRRWLCGNILLLTSGVDKERLEGRGQDLLTPTGEVVAREADSTRRQALQEYLDGILEEAEQQSQWSELESATAQLGGEEEQRKLKDIADKISVVMDGIERMRAFPGRCHLCPV